VLLLLYPIGVDDNIMYQIFSLPRNGTNSISRFKIVKKLHNCTHRLMSYLILKLNDAVLLLNDAVLLLNDAMLLPSPLLLLNDAVLL
jgi:hypothetical protein